MSKPIKFRAWHKADKKMYKVSGFSQNKWFLQGKNIPMPDGAIEIMQYTGLQDRNGKEIYEGDIVKQTYVTQSGNVHDGTDMTFSGHHVGKVVITARGVCLKNPLHYSDDTDESSYMNAYKQVAGYRSEVIGNAFDHPHLLKGDDTDAT